MTHRAWILLLTTAACNGDGPSPDGEHTTDDGTEDTGTPPPTLTPPPTTTTGTPCDPPLSVTPADVGVDVSDLVQFTAHGGTGHAVWSLASPAQGSISADFGSYRAPDVVGAVDTVILHDAGCDGEATATVTVGDPFTVLPPAATVRPGTAFTFEVTGGSGAHACARITDGSGGSLAACAYTAGPAEGVDVIEVRDTGTGEAVEVTIGVDADAAWTIEGAGGIVVPLGATFRPRIVGGSGVVDATVLSGALTAVDGGFRADGPGPGRVRLRDRFAGFEATVGTVGATPRVPPSLWYGEQSLQGELVAPGDLDGDGYDDAVVGFLEANAGAWYGGAAAVWRGGASGFAAAPDWSTVGTSSEAYLGRSVLVEDLDGDDQPELLVGADGDDVGASNVGSVTVWRGAAGGTFEAEPWKLLRGVYSGDRSGGSLGACDVDGDGIVDLAVGAWAHEDRSGDTYPSDTGALLLFRGYLDHDGEVDWPESPTVLRYGAYLDGLGGWVSQASSQAGLLGMATGDVDGDGDCDIALATYGDGAFGDTNGYGYVTLYEGLPSAEGTLSELPTRTYANLTDSNANLGRDLAMGDVEGDGLSDLLIGAWAWDGRSGSSGGAFLYLGDSWDGRDGTDPIEPTEADWFVVGREASDYLGVDVDLRDVDGDGHDDVLVGAPRGEIPYGVANAGAVLGWSGAAVTPGAAHDATDDPRLVEVGGAIAESFFGQGFAAVGDADGDSVLDLVVLEGRVDELGLDVGRVVAVSAAGAREELSLPGEPSGNDHGRGVTLHDADGDGVADLVVGSPQDADTVKGLFSGSVYRFHGAGDGSFAATATEVGGVHPDLSSSDRAGFAVEDTDFDGDGRGDLVVAARTDSEPSSFGAHVVNATECPMAVSSAGSVAVFRGTASGTSDTPAFLFYGPDASAQVRLLAGGFDHDGDGVDDLLVGGRDWRLEGGIGIVHGRAANPAGTTVICDADRWYGLLSGDLFGEGIAVLHDLDGDGCDEVAVGAPREDTVLVNQGVVRILWGYGPRCAAGPRVTALAPNVASAGVGEALAGGADVDGDGLDDLVVTSVEWRVDNEHMGGAWLVPGSWIRSLPTQLATVGLLPDAASTQLQPMVPPAGHWGVNGVVPAGRFGQSVALLPDPTRPTRAWVALGVPDGDEGGTLFAGGLRVHRFATDLGDGQPGLEPIPWMVVGGETHLPDGDLGEVVGAERSGGRSMLWFGAPLSSQGGLRVGAAYAVPVEVP